MKKWSWVLILFCFTLFEGLESAEASRRGGFGAGGFGRSGGSGWGTGASSGRSTTSRNRGGRATRSRQPRPGPYSGHPAAASASGQSAAASTAAPSSGFTFVVQPAPAAAVPAPAPPPPRQVFPTRGKKSTFEQIMYWHRRSPAQIFDDFNTILKEPVYAFGRSDMGDPVTIHAALGVQLRRYSEVLGNVDSMRKRVVEAARAQAQLVHQNAIRSSTGGTLFIPQKHVTTHQQVRHSAEAQAKQKLGFADQSFEGTVTAPRSTTTEHDMITRIQNLGEARYGAELTPEQVTLLQRKRSPQSKDLDVMTAGENDPFLHVNIDPKDGQIYRIGTFTPAPYNPFVRARAVDGFIYRGAVRTRNFNLSKGPLQLDEWARKKSHFIPFSADGFAKFIHYVQ